MIRSILALSLILSSSFGFSQNDSGIVINPNKLEQNAITLGKIAIDVEYIPMETTTESLFSTSGPCYAWIIDSRIVILDHMKSKLLIFDKNGKFITKVGSKGRGLGEYVTISSVSIDENVKTILVFDERTNIILEFDLNGELVNTIRLDSQEKIRKCISYNGQIAYKYYGGISHGIRIIDKKGKPIKDISLGKRSGNSLDISFDSFSKNGERLFYSPFPFLSFYHINKDFTITKSNGIVITKNPMPKEYFKQDKIYFQNLRNYNSIGGIRNWGTIFWLRLQRKDEGIFVLYNKEQNWITELEGIGLLNDYDHDCYDKVNKPSIHPKTGQVLK